MTTTPKVGDHVLAVVPRSSNAGQDHAPATVTRVNPDGTVNLRVFVDRGDDQRVTKATILADRAAINAELVKHFADLPSISVTKPDGEIEVLPGIGPNGQPWNHSDVAHWIKLAYYDRPVVPETEAEKAIRLHDEAAAREATRLARIAALHAELAELDPAV